MIRARVDENRWCRCGKCGHKMFLLKSKDDNRVEIEIKCHSCKEINEVDVGSAS